MMDYLLVILFEGVSDVHCYINFNRYMGHGRIRSEVFFPLLVENCY